MKQLRIMRGERPQTEIADALKITSSYYSYIESGHRVPSLALAIRIAEFFQVPVETLFIIEKGNIRLS